MRTTFLATCDTVCEIRDPGASISGPGGEKPGPVVTRQQPCRVASLTGSEREVGGRLSGIADILVSFAWGEEVSWDSTIVVGDIKYAVVRIAAAQATQPAALQVYGQGVS